MDLYEVFTGSRLDVITEEVLSGDEEHQEEVNEEEVNRDLPTKEAFVVVSEKAETRTFQRFSTDTNDSLRFEAYVPSSDEEGTPSPDSSVDGHDDVFEEHKKSENKVNNIRTKLEEKVVEMENFAGHLEEIFLTVEDNFGRQEQHLEHHYNDVLQTLSQRYDERAAALGEEKKRRLEALYTQLLGCGRTLDASKDLIETAQELYRTEDKQLFLQAVMPTMKRIEEFAKEKPDLTLVTTLEFDRPLANLSDVKTMMDSINIVPAPSAPVINPQVCNSATPTSLRVCWSLFSDDSVEYYELYYRPVLEDTPAADSTKGPDVSNVKVKETHCSVGDLLPNAQYEFWVTATNTTGISPASEKAVYMTVPSPPFIRQRECSSCPEAALIRWESRNTNPVDSYTVELIETGTDGQSGVTESIVAVPTCESLIQLQSGRQYLIYVRAVNIGGSSERSEAFTVSTSGTIFHLLQDTAHPCLSISEDGFSMFYGDEELPLSAMTFDDNTFARCVAVLGDLIPVRGRHYWEVEVEEDTEYRIGVAYEDTQRNSYLGGTNTSWCMRHVLTPSRHKYEFLHSGWSPDIRITVNPVRIGLSLNYERGILSFFNVDLEQHLHTFYCSFLHYVHPCFALDNPGRSLFAMG